MRALGINSTSGGARGEQTRLRNQMKRLFGCSVTLIYEDAQMNVTASSFIADRTAFWWNESKPAEPVLFNSEIRLGEDFFNEIIRHPVPLNMNTLTALKRSSLGLDLYLWLVYRTFPLRASATDHLAAGLPSVWSGTESGQRQSDRPSLPPQGFARVEEDQAGLAGVELRHGSGRPDPAPLDPGDSTRSIKAS